MKWDVVLFCIGLLCVAFAYGIAVERYHLFPHHVVVRAAAAVQDWRANWRHYFQLRSKYLMPTVRTTGGVTRHDRAAASPGYTFLTLFRDDRFGATLIDMEGRPIHTWDIAFSTAFPNQHHLEIAPPDFDIALHATALLPNGDVILNMEGAGAVRLDRCSNIVWRLPVETHHSIDYLPDGELLITADRKHYAAEARWPGLVPGRNGYFWENMVLRLRPDGSLAERVSILDVVYNSGWAALLFSDEKPVIETEEPMHVNDVEVLRADMAAAFPLFRAGDVMLSLRNASTILVVDGRTWRIKWTMTGPFLYQHDPDFLPNGHILVFDNRRTGGRPKLGQSRILEIDPNTRDIVWSYQGSDEEPFYTELRGMQQLLPNGNILVVEAEHGRVFELKRGSPDRIVWEYVNLAEDGFVGLVTGAERVAPETLTFLGAGCG